MSNGVKFHRITKDPETRQISMVEGQLLSSEDAAVLVARTEPWRELLYPLDSLTAVPFFRPDGSVITKRGYYEDLRLYNVADLGLTLGDSF